MRQNVGLKWHLRALHNEAFDSQEVGPFQSFEAEVVESVVARVHNCSVETLSVGHHDAVGLLAADKSKPFFGHAAGLLEAGEVVPDETSAASCARVDVRVEVVDDL
jgi:hypothetical protein